MPNKTPPPNEKMRTRAGRVALVIASFVLMNGCVGVRSRVDLPSCSEVTSAEGEHLQHPGSVIFDHGNDFPMTVTKFVVDHEDGSQTRAYSTNSVPDLFHVFGGSTLMLLGAAAVAFYAVDVTRGASPIESESFLLLPTGIALGALAGYFLLTGWHPSETLVLPSKCQQNFDGAGEL